jgi:hypothetical protein
MTTIAAFKDMLIPAIKAFCNVPIIGADQLGDRPDGAHATFKITSPFIKGVGQSEEIGEFGETSYQLRRIDPFKRVLSFTAYDLDEDVSHELAQQIHDWFSYHGYEFLTANNIVVAEQSAVSNRDAFVIDGYERRNGFDVTLRMTREIIKEIAYVEKVDVFDDLAAETVATTASNSEYASYEQPLEMAGAKVLNEDAII